MLSTPPQAVQAHDQFFARLVRRAGPHQPRVGPLWNHPDSVGEAVAHDGRQLSHRGWAGNRQRVTRSVAIAALADTSRSGQEDTTPPALNRPTRSRVTAACGACAHLQVPWARRNSWAARDQSSGWIRGSSQSHPDQPQHVDCAGQHECTRKMACRIEEDAGNRRCEDPGQITAAVLHANPTSGRARSGDNLRNGVDPGRRDAHCDLK